MQKVCEVHEARYLDTEIKTVFVRLECNSKTIHRYDEFETPEEIQMMVVYTIDEEGEYGWVEAVNPEVFLEHPEVGFDKLMFEMNQKEKSFYDIVKEFWREIGSKDL